MAFTKTCRLLTMIGLTASFFLVEIIVGYVTNSIALVADSFHMLSDVVALIVGFACVRIAKWPSKRNTFGWIRAEVLGALVNAVFLLALCFSILVESLKRLVELEKIENPKLLLIVGVVGLLVNIIGLVLFHDHSHGHSHGGGGGGSDDGHSHGGKKHSHGDVRDCSDDVKGRDEQVSLVTGHTEESGDIKHTDNSLAIDVEHDDHQSMEQDSPKLASSGHLNMKGVFLHVLGDALGSVIVIISALVIWFIEDDWRFYVDPVMSIILVMIILCTTIPLFKESAFILLQAVPAHIRTERIRCKLEKLEGIRAIHEFHVWQLAGNRIVASAHVSCLNVHEYMMLASKIKELFHNEGIHSTTIQPEFIEIDEMANGKNCALECGPDLKCFTDTCCGRRNVLSVGTEPAKKTDTYIGCYSRKSSNEDSNTNNANKNANNRAHENNTNTDSNINATTSAQTVKANKSEGKDRDTSVDVDRETNIV